LPPVKISVSMATANGGSFWSLFWWFSLSILQGFYVGLVQNMRFRCGNLVKRNLSIVVSFVVLWPALARSLCMVCIHKKAFHRKGIVIMLTVHYYNLVDMLDRSLCWQRVCWWSFRHKSTIFFIVLWVMVITTFTRKKTRSYFYENALGA
jgi:hypothetical protein